MLQAMLELFTTSEKAEAMLESPIIELIFMALFGLFILTLILHLALFFKIRHIRNYVKQTNRMDIEPLHAIQREFDTRQTKESIKLETFIQEKFSSWRMFQIPVISLIKLVQMTISVFILLGVLGTFIGLTISLGSISASSDQLIENVAGVLSGIDVAFYTSIVGMGFSLIMTVLVRVLNTEYLLTDLMLIVESQLESHEQHGMNRMIEVSEDIHIAIQSLEKNNQQSLDSLVEAFAGFANYTEDLQKSAEDLGKFNDGLSDNLRDFHDLFEQMQVVTDGFSEGTAQLNHNFSSLFSYFQKVDRQNERMAESFEYTYEKIQAVSESQINSLQEFDESVVELKKFTTSILDAQADVRKSFENITDRTKALVETLGAHNKTLKEIFGANLTERLSDISSYIADLKYGFDRVGDAIGTLPEALRVINETQKEHQYLLGDRFRELKEFNQTFNQHLKNHELEGVKLEKQMRDAAATFELLGTKNSGLLNEMNRMITEANQTFSKRDQQLATNVGGLQDTFTNHAANIENTLTQKLDTMIRNIDNSLYSLSDGMNRELVEMRRVSEEISQNHARLIQQLLQELGREIQTLNRQISSFGPRPSAPTSPTRTIGMNRDEL
ncbi:MotA/TolQ/ExbB proton channel family protein [Pseudogracilibacillus sp. SO30301A]|uniref:MotA/TolQ/ExbB proton channel family protein n=1 Tax=Pseudogracilibacillus sp. SO30301A TaxID=3098291 RepID=UPI00300DFACD